MDMHADSTIEISYDNGVISGSSNPGWMFRDTQGDWRPIQELQGLQEWEDPGRPAINGMTDDEIVELLDQRGYEATVVR